MGDDLLVARLNGIWRSLDGGATWTQPDSELCPDRSYFWVYQIRRSPDNPNQLAAQVDAALYISSNNGNTWQNTIGNCGSSTISEWGIRWHPGRNGEIWYKVTDHYMIMTNYGEQLKIIFDIGDIIGPDNMNIIQSIAFSQSDPDTVIMQTNRGTLLSGDGGVTWQEFSLPDSLKNTSNIREIPEKPGYYLIKKYDIKQYLFYTTDNFKTIKTYKVTDDANTIIWNPTDEFHFYQGNLYLATNKGIESVPLSEFE